MTTEDLPGKKVGAARQKPEPGSGSGSLVLTRREMLKWCGWAGAALWGITAVGGGRTLAGDLRQRRARALIQIWLGGGLSHVDTFDPKPEAGPDVCGPWVGVLETNVPGLRVGVSLPRLARQADKFCVIRGMTHDCEDHLRAAWLMRWGWDPGLEADAEPLTGTSVWPGLNSAPGTGGGLVPWIFPPEHAGGGAGPAARPGLVWWVPRSVLEELEGKDDGPGRTRAQPGPSPFHRVVAAPGQARTLGSDVCVHAIPEWTGASGRAPGAAEAWWVKWTIRLRTGSERYGHHAFGRACELALRLVEAGVTAVVVEWKGWDTHREHFRYMEHKLRELDEGLSALLAGLAGEGLLSETVVWAGGEFGRSPRLKWDLPWNGGRDHWSRAFSVVLAGGGIRGGQVVGATNRTGEEVVDRPVHPAELVGTVAGLLGRTVWWTPPGGPHPGRTAVGQGNRFPGLLREIAGWT